MKTNLKQLRKAAGWKNADDFARSINMSPKTYRNYEQGIRSIGLDVAAEICNALNCSINDLIPEQFEYAYVSFNDSKSADNSKKLTNDEMELVNLYRSLPQKGQHAVLTGLRDFAEME